MLTINRLHNEILDFYDFVEPQPYEHELRNQLVNRVQNALGTRRFPQDSGRVLCFGSFPAGLYLPTADMDLVYTSDRHYNGGPPVLDFSQRGAHKSLLYKASRRLTDTRMTKDKPLVIASAKVPIIKFTDSITGLQVDISFENLSGVQAQATFAHWKRTYPDMIYMVALLKQFLVMRGLNEVHTGGIGGFSIICLIVSYIHHAPKHENLGECFRGFLDYYGNKFDLATQRLQMHPPGVVNKVSDRNAFAVLWQVLTSSRHAMVLMTVKRRQMAFRFKILIAQRTTSLVDPTRRRMRSKPSRLRIEHSRTVGQHRKRART